MVALTAVALLGMGACAGDDSAAVEMRGQEFLPPDVSVKAGEEIVFTNTSDEAHSVTAYEDELPQGADYFASGGFTTEAEARAEVAGSLLGPGDDFSVTLTEPGSYRYFCIPHEDAGMVGRIVVNR